MSASSHKVQRGGKCWADGFISATLVRNGLLGREDALKKEAALKRDLEKEYLELMADLGAHGGPPPGTP